MNFYEGNNTNWLFNGYFGVTLMKFRDGFESFGSSLKYIGVVDETVVMVVGNELGN